MPESRRVAILGAGSWGLAISGLLQTNGHAVSLWEFNQADYELIKVERTHPKKLPSFRLPDNVHISNDLSETIANAEIIVLAVPSQSLRSVLKQIDRHIVNNPLWINLAKGIENNSLLRMSEVIAEETSADPNRIMTLSGPSHAEEVAMDMPTAVVCAGFTPPLLEMTQHLFSTRTFRVYQSTDLIGVELGGSLKNIIAIAAGICAGLQTGDNTLGALITRGLAEISRLGISLGAEPETFAGLSGIGDLITTCSSRHSRNRYVGEKIGQGEKLENILANMSMVAEGVKTTQSGYQLMKKHNVEMPITTEVYEVLFNNKPPDSAVRDLMTRSLKPEIWQ